MEKKLAVIVDNKEVITETENIELCSSAFDVAMGTCSSQSHDACGDCGVFATENWMIKDLNHIYKNDIIHI